MGQALDESGELLGPEIFGDSMKDVFNKVQDKHRDAAEIRLRKLRESVSELENKYDDEAREIVRKIDTKLGSGWAKQLADVLD